MSRPLTSAHISLQRRSYDPKLLSEHLTYDNPLAHEVARPLFKNGVLVAAMTCRKGYHCSAGFTLKRLGHHTLILLLQGELTVQTANGAVEMRPGDLVFCGPDMPFAYTGRRNLVSWWLYFKISDTPYWEPLKRNGPSLQAYDSADLMFLLLRRILDAHRRRDLRGLSVARGDAHMLLTLLSRLRNNQSQPDALTDRVRLLVEQVAAAPDKDWSVASMASTLCVSSRTLFRLFKKEYGCSPMEMVIQQRLNLAIQYLTDTGDTIASIALNCGYKSVYSFSRLFHKHIGMPPAECRRQLNMYGN